MARDLSHRDRPTGRKHSDVFWVSLQPLMCRASRRPQRGCRSTEPATTTRSIMRCPLPTAIRFVPAHVQSFVPAPVGSLFRGSWPSRVVATLTDLLRDDCQRSRDLRPLRVPQRRAAEHGASQVATCVSRLAYSRNTRPRKCPVKRPQTLQPQHARRLRILDAVPNSSSSEGRT